MGTTSGAQDLAQHTAGANAGQLVGITYHDNAAVVTRGGQQRLEQLDIHHTHLIQNDNVKLEKILFIMDKTHAAGRIVHFQQSVDGGSAVAGQLGQPLGGAAGGGTQGNPVINTFIQIRIALTVVVLPVPGPPVKTITRVERASGLLPAAKAHIQNLGSIPKRGYRFPAFWGFLSGMWQAPPAAQQYPALR